MSNETRVCDASAISEGQLNRFSLADFDVVLTRYEGQVVALEDRCGHMAAPLSLGTLAGRTLTCPLHNAAFDILTGKAVKELSFPPTPPGQEPNPRLRMISLPRTYPVRTFPAFERDGAVFLELPG